MADRRWRPPPIIRAPRPCGQHVPQQAMVSHRPHRPCALMRRDRAALLQSPRRHSGRHRLKGCQVGSCAIFEQFFDLVDVTLCDGALELEVLRLWWRWRRRGAALLARHRDDVRSPSAPRAAISARGSLRRWTGPTCASFWRWRWASSAQAWRYERLKILFGRFSRCAAATQLRQSIVGGDVGRAVPAVRRMPPKEKPQAFSFGFRDASPAHSASPLSALLICTANHSWRPPLRPYA